MIEAGNGLIFPKRRLALLKKLKIGGRFFIKTGFLILALFLAYHFIDFRKFWGGLSLLSLPIIVGLLVVASLDRMAMAAKWFHLAKGLHVRFPPRECVKSYYASSFLNYFVPTSLGGDILRGEWMSRVVGQKKEVYATLIMEKVIGLLSTVGLSWFGLIYFLNKWNSPLKKNVGLALLILSFIAILFLALSLHPQIYSLTMKLLNKYKVGKITSALEKVYECYIKFGESKGHLFVNFLIGIAENIIQFGIAYLATIGLGLDIGFITLVAIMGLVTCIRRLAAYLDSWGFSETVTVAMFGLVGIEPSVALAISLLGHISIILASLPGGFFMSRGVKS